MVNAISGNRINLSVKVVRNAGFSVGEKLALVFGPEGFDIRGVNSVAKRDIISHGVVQSNGQLYFSPSRKGGVDAERLLRLLNHPGLRNSVKTKVTRRKIQVQF